MTVGGVLYSFQWSVIVSHSCLTEHVRQKLLDELSEISSFIEFVDQQVISEVSVNSHFWIPKITGRSKLCLRNWYWLYSPFWCENKTWESQECLVASFGIRNKLWSFRLFLNVQKTDVFLYCKEITNCLFFAWAKICMNMIQKSCLKWSSDVAGTKRSSGGCGWSNSGTYYWTRCFDMLF